MDAQARHNVRYSMLVGGRRGQDDRYTARMRMVRCPSGLSARNYHIDAR